MGTSHKRKEKKKTRNFFSLEGEDYRGEFIERSAEYTSRLQQNVYFVRIIMPANVQSTRGHAKFRIGNITRLCKRSLIQKGSEHQG